MPFDFEAYDIKCANMSAGALQVEWQSYKRYSVGGSTSTVISLLAALPSGGSSLLSLGISGPQIYNARKKLKIIERHLNRLGTTHRTRMRDVVSATAISGATGIITLGLVPAGGDLIAEMGISALGQATAETVGESVSNVVQFGIEGGVLAGEKEHHKTVREEYSAGIKR